MLRINHINATFNQGTRDEVRALRDLNLTVPQGAFIILIGTNGSGKSTLLNLIAGTITPESGSIHIDEQDVTRMPDWKRAGMIARVFQNPFSGTAPGMTVAENLHLASLRGSHHLPVTTLTHQQLESYHDLLAHLEMNLEGRLHHPVGLLSGGQRQAITLLMAVMTRPKILLLDEHTAALDPRSAALLSQLTSEWITRDNLTTLMVTHSMNQALTMGTGILMMHQGTIIESYSAEEKRHMTIAELNARFDEIRKLEQLTPERIAELSHQYG